MIIRKDNQDFQRLSLEILNECPAEESNEFTDGYLDFVEVLFDELEAFSNVLWNYSEGTCEIDFELLFDEANKTIARRSSSNEFKRGAKWAEGKTLEAMIFAFKWEPKHQAA